MKAPKNGKRKLGTLEHEIDNSWGDAMRQAEAKTKSAGDDIARPYKKWPRGF